MITTLPFSFNKSGKSFKNFSSEPNSSFAAILNAWNTCLAGCPFLANSLAGKLAVITSTT